ncbi:MAG TPA: prenyltransferase/squalene oxidase repeat-containing protein [Pirellulales bacterium]|jgi:squalene-hopene/tetraprenyl-beta-curcumene cyclase
MSKVALSFSAAACLGLAVVTGTATRAAENAAGLVDSKAQEQAVAKAIEYLRTKGQAEDGSFSSAAGPAVTALVTAGVLESGRTAQDPVVAKALKYLQGFVQPDGGIYQPESRHRNYETCIGLMCFAAANKDGRFDSVVKNAEKFLKAGQLDESENVQPSNIAYGGAGYGQAERPDLSNTHFLLDALKAAGEGADDEAFKRALVFVSRCQNLESEHNTTEFPAKNPDGGFYYTPAGGGRSMAGNTENGGLRSYGSMTYAGLKSMIYCGAKPDDPRVKAAVTWAKKHYTLDENPGMADAGLYYYYQLFAKALSAMNQPTIVDESGKSHDWRNELVTAIISRQQPDGSWVNKNARWMEGDPNLVTGYALLALANSRAEAK